MAVDDAQFRELLAGEYARLCWLGCLLTGSAAEGEELAQEALVRIWWRWRLGGGGGPLPGPGGTTESAGHRALARLRERLGTPNLDPAGSNPEERR